MLLLPQRRLFLNTNSHYNRAILMGSKHLLLLTSTLTPEKYSIFYIFENHISISSDELWVELLPQCRHAYSQTSAKVGIRKRKVYLSTSQKMVLQQCGPAFGLNVGGVALQGITKAKQPFREITEESLELEPLCNELLAFFAERMISGETLQRNSVMQKRRGTQVQMMFNFQKCSCIFVCNHEVVLRC
ncbi:primase homolog protein-like isoform X2 [Olea europaea var. sylvestris]|uniref:primase homolog protein-like isoform X2 n=1 Tax=Olea europaea var. sylvestris TaxID=158386 RepID=UPI000C1D5D11|nr:primase homolog protein-like isoform X2 [Olea europaea var. sylvestris]